MKYICKKCPVPCELDSGSAPMPISELNEMGCGCDWRKVEDEEPEPVAEYYPLHWGESYYLSSHCPGCKEKDEEIERLKKQLAAEREKIKVQETMHESKMRGAASILSERDDEIKRLRDLPIEKIVKAAQDVCACERTGEQKLNHLIKLFERREARDVATEKRNAEIASSNAGAIHMLEQMADAIDHISDELDKWEPAK